MQSGASQKSRSGAISGMKMIRMGCMPERMAHKRLAHKPERMAHRLGRMAHRLGRTEHMQRGISQTVRHVSISGMFRTDHMDHKQERTAHRQSVHKPERTARKLEHTAHMLGYMDHKPVRMECKQSGASQTVRHVSISGMFRTGHMDRRREHKAHKPERTAHIRLAHKASTLSLHTAGRTGPLGHLS